MMWSAGVIEGVHARVRPSAQCALAGR
jgi:hypothetical protein